MRAPSSLLLPASVVAVTLCCAGCASSGAPTPTTLTAPATTLVTSPPTSPATVPATPAGAGSAKAAADSLVAAWSRDDRTAAVQVASASAVATLFAAHYPGAALAGSRGCGDVPVVCTYGPGGGANPDDALYQLTVSQDTAGRWYVSEVLVEG